jgi:hypothetical protein
VIVFDNVDAAETSWQLPVPTDHVTAFIYRRQFELIPIMFAHRTSLKLVALVQAWQRKS